MKPTELGIRWFFLLTWTLHSIAFFVFDWTEAPLLLWAVNVAGFLGLAVAVAWLRAGNAWRRPCIYVSSLVVVLYITRWFINISNTYRAEPEIGVLAAIGRVAYAVSARFTWQEERLGAISAILHLYWDVLMLPVQLLVVAILVWLPSALPVSATD